MPIEIFGLGLGKNEEAKEFKELLYFFFSIFEILMLSNANAEAKTKHHKGEAMPRQC